MQNVNKWASIKLYLQKKGGGMLNKLRCYWLLARLYSRQLEYTSKIKHTASSSIMDYMLYSCLFA